MFSLGSTNAQVTINPKENKVIKENIWVVSKIGFKNMIWWLILRETFYFTSRIRKKKYYVKDVYESNKK